MTLVRGVAYQNYSGLAYTWNFHIGDIPDAKRRNKKEKKLSKEVSKVTSAMVPLEQVLNIDAVEIRLRIHFYEQDEIFVAESGTKLG